MIIAVNINSASADTKWASSPSNRVELHH